MTLPIAVTSGDPSGIGPEITLKAWQALKTSLPFFLIGDAENMRSCAAQFGGAIEEIEHPSDATKIMPNALPVLHQACASQPILGHEQPENAESVIASITRCVELVRDGQASALCTNPIHKKILVDGANFKHPGHTEFLAELAGVKRTYMMLAAPELRVVPVTIHIALSDVPNALTETLFEDTVRATHAALISDFGIPAPRLAVAGLNPHAGEGGLMGTEEQTLIAPLCEQLRDEGFDITGPLSADTMFHPAARETYDVALCMYHDQALIPIKTLNFSHGVNVTLGMPFIRTSPDHGTAFNIAGNGIADASSLIEALRLAATMAQHRKAAIA